MKRQEKTKPVVKTTKEKEEVKVRGELKFIPISPRKLRLVVNMIKEKGYTPSQALKVLPLVNKKGARFVLKALKSVVSNAQNVFGLDPQGLRFEEIVVNEGPRLKRRDRFHGARFNPGIIQKRRSHLRIVVKGEKES